MKKSTILKCITVTVIAILVWFIWLTYMRNTSKEDYRETTVATASSSETLKVQLEAYMSKDEIGEHLYDAVCYSEDRPRFMDWVIKGTRIGKRNIIKVIPNTGVVEEDNIIVTEDKIKDRNVYRVGELVFIQRGYTDVLESDKSTSIKIVYAHDQANGIVSDYKVIYQK